MSAHPYVSEWREGHLWCQGLNNPDDSMEYCVAIEQPDLEAAEKLLRENGYTIIPPAKPLTFEDVVPMTEAPEAPEAPEDRTEYWVLDVTEPEGVASYRWCGDKYDELAIKRRMAYLDREHALVAAEYIFGLKGGAL